MAWGPLSGSSSQVITSAAAGAAPTYSSGEIGVVDSETVEITFSENVDTDSDYTTGVTIMVGSVSYTGFSGAIQSDKSKVRYVLVAGVDGTETVTWAYSESSGGIKSESSGVALEDVSAQEVTNTAFEPGDLSGTTYWWHVRPSAANGVSGSDAEAIATWTENAGSQTFVQATGANKPTLKLAANGINGLGVLRFDGADDYMTSSLILSGIFAAGAKAAWFVIKVANMGPAAAWDLCDTILTDTGGYWGAVIDTDEVVQANASPNKTAQVSASIDTVYVVEMRHDSGTIYTSLNGGSEASTVSGDTSNITNTIKIGTNFADAVFFDGDIAEIITSNNAQSSGDRASMRTVLENIYGV